MVVWACIPALIMLRQEGYGLVDWRLISFGSIHNDEQNTIYSMRNTTAKMLKIYTAYDK